MAKFCKSCQTEKSVTEFHPRSDSSGYRFECKQCHRIRGRKMPSKRKTPLLSPEEKRARRLAACRKHNAKPERRAKCNYYQATRRAKELAATPKWLTKEQLSHIKCFYELAKALSLVAGEPAEVDHIVPLKGKNVCGLHVPWNLTVTSKEFNNKKNNKYEI